MGLLGNEKLGSLLLGSVGGAGSEEVHVPKIIDVVGSYVAEIEVTGTFLVLSYATQND